MQHIGQALAAEFLRDRQAAPAALAIGVVGLLEALWHLDRAVVVAAAALAVAG